MKMWRTFAAAIFGLTLLSAAPARALAEWDNVPRIVAIADLHGDYDKFVDQLRIAQLIDANHNWIGGRAHLVQLGDVPDRGDHSRQIMDLLIRLEPQARRAGGYVHALIGNHEAMNVTGDLRYVSAGEYASFATRNAARLRDQLYRASVGEMRRHPPAAGLPAFDAAFRAQWDSEHPLGYAEHRQNWAPNGRYGRWVAGHDTVIRINDTLFMHGGLGPSFANVGRQTMNDAVRGALRGRPIAAYADILDNQEGPLWYRGLASNAEESERANVEAILAQNRVQRIVLGHTKVASTVLPRFGGRVLLADIAVPSGHNDPHAFVIIENGAVSTIHRGQRVPLDASTPAATCAYLTRVAEIDGGTGPVATLATRQCAAATAQ